MTSTRISDALKAVEIPDGVRPSKPVPFEQTEEYRETLRRMRESRLRKAGLRGAYMSARSDVGERVCALIESGRGAYLWGEPGRGKTYAAAHAVRVAVERSKGSKPPAKLVSAKQLLDSIREGFNGGDRDALRRAEAVPLLALDDLGAERPTDWAIETLTGLIDARTAEGLPTIVTSNYSLGQLRELWGGMPGARIASRLGGACERIEVTGPDRRLR
jgi:DNA replication protein DnaC